MKSYDDRRTALCEAKGYLTLYFFLVQYLYLNDNLLITIKLFIEGFLLLAELNVFQHLEYIFQHEKEF